MVLPREYFFRITYSEVLFPEKPPSLGRHWTEQDKRNEPSKTPINEYTDDDETDYHVNGEYASSDSNNTSIFDNRNEYDICLKKP